MMKKLLIAGAILGFLGLLGAVGLYLFVDSQVVRRLKTRGTREAGVIYSAPLKISAGEKVPPEQLRSELLARDYIETASAPTKPGEFRISGAQAAIYTKSFTDGFAVTHPEILWMYDCAAGEIIGSDGEKREELLIDPRIIAALGGASVRASKYVPLTQIPDVVQKAVIAVEDERFYKHSGVDAIGIARAMAANIKARRIVQGGSTLTQQLAKNILFTPRKTLGRKVLEAVAALSLERRLSKEEILELYLNEVYLGQEGAVAIHGVAEAGMTFLNKPLQRLSLGDAALLAGIIRAPSYYSPRRHLSRALQRREIVLRKMLEKNFIDAAAFSRAVEVQPKIVQELQHPRLAPHFQAALTRDLNEYVSVRSAALEGVRVYTGLEPELQQCAAKAVEEGLQELEKRNPKLRRAEAPLEAALLAVEPYSGLIRAWQGGRDFAQNQYDHVDQGRRQIGSTVKPFLYLTALDRNLNEYKTATPDMVLPDRPLEFTLANNRVWAPENYDHRFRGEVTLRYALENSLNIPAAYVGHRVGVPALARTLGRFHLADRLPEVPAITLGALDTSLLRLTAAFGALANGGLYVKPRLFISAIEREGAVLARTLIEEERAADEGAVYVLTNILQGVIERGTARSIRRMGYERPAAGKTGTSDEARDAWFIGYVPNLVAGVWVGYDDNAKLGLTGSAAAAPIWTRFMQCADWHVKPASFVPPPGVVFVNIDAATHLLADEHTPPEQVVREVFVRGTEPRRSARPLEETRPLRAHEEGEPPPLPRRPRRRSFWEILTGE